MSNLDSRLIHRTTVDDLNSSNGIHGTDDRSGFKFNVLTAQFEQARDMREDEVVVLANARTRIADQDESVNTVMV